MGITLTLIIIIMTGLISYQAFNDPAMKSKLLHRPIAEHNNKEYYRLLTSGFIHADFMHLGINMYVLYIFGTQVEMYFMAYFGDVIGKISYLAMYLISIVAASLFTHFKHQNNPAYAALGASGATSAVLFAFVIFNPWSMLLLFFVIPCPAIVAAILYLVYSSWASKNSRDNIGHDAHFWGAVFGFVFTMTLITVFSPDLIPRLISNLMTFPGF